MDKGKSTKKAKPLAIKGTFEDVLKAAVKPGEYWRFSFYLSDHLMAVRLLKANGVRPEYDYYNTDEYIDIYPKGQWASRGASEPVTSMDMDKFKTFLNI